MPSSKRTAGKVRTRLERAAGAAIEQLEVRRLMAWTPVHYQATVQEIADSGPFAASAGATPSEFDPAGAPQVAGGLAGRVTYTHGGHGYVYDPTWRVMRSFVNGMMEDMGNQDQITPYANYLLNAGATVVSMRPVGHQTEEVIVDNSDAYTAVDGGFDVVSGSWSNSTGATYWSNNNGNDAVHYRFASTVTGSETAVARYTPKIDVAGFYPVYTWTNPGSNDANNNRAGDQIYRIKYSGGSQEIKVASNKTGKGWVYLGTYYFAAGVSQANGAVEISNLSATSGKVVIADGIRFGNGMGTYDPPGAGGVSGKSREDECALYWCYNSLGWSSAGVRLSDDLVDGGSTSDDEVKNFSACARWAAYMNNEAVGTDVERLWISFHSNAGGGRGTVGLITSGPTPNQSWLANAAGVTVRDEMIALNSTHEYNWFNDPSPTFTGGYSEISNSSLNGEMDATIIEVAFHDDAMDAALMKDPKVRNEVGRSAYHTAIKYFDQFDATFTNNTYLPEPVRNLRVTSSAANTDLTVTWQAPQSSSGTTGPYGNAATGYRVWTSTNGYGFDLAGTTASTNFTLSGLSTTAVTYIRVTATNAGGESMPSVVAGAKPQSGRRAPILIVNNFDRLDRPGDETESHYFGTISRARERYNNSKDYVVQAAEAIENYNSNLGIEYCTDVGLSGGGSLNLNNYFAVIWLSGEQSTANETFDATTQPLVTTYLNNGGKMFVSGAEIAWDLQGQASETAADTTFLNGTLHASYGADDAATYATAAGIAGSALAGVPVLNFDNGTHGTYNVDTADELVASGAGASVAMNYSTGAGNGAVIQYASGNTRLIFMGFGFESIYNAGQRNSLMSAVMTYFNAAIVAPPAPDLVAATDTGALNTDNLTNRDNSFGKTLQFTVSTAPGMTVELFAGATLIGSATSSSNSVTITTDATNVLGEATHAITVKQGIGVTTSASSGGLPVTVDTTPPLPPAALTATASGTGINVDWDPSPSPQPWRYRVMRSTTSGSGYTQVGLVTGPTTNYNDTTAVPGTVYYYVVNTEDNAANQGGNSAEVNDFVPLPPTGVDLLAASDSGSSNTDNYTNFDNSGPKPLDFSVSGTFANATIRLYVDGVFHTSVVATGTPTSIAPSSVLADGVRSIQVTQQELGRPESIAATLSVTIDNVVAAPTALDLVTASDSGSSSSDNNTNDNTPSFTLTAEALGTATIEVDGIAVASAPNLTTSYTVNVTSAVADGPRTITAFVTDKAGNVSSDSASLAVTIDTTAPAQPPAPDLDPASDSGSLDSDNITNDTTPLLNGTAEANARVDIMNGAFVAGFANADGSGNYAITTTPFTSGSYNLAARVTDLAGNVSINSAALPIVIDTVAPSSSIPDLDAASDSGTSSTDNLTNDSTPTLSGTSELGAIVDFRVDNVIVATDSDGNGSYSFTSALLTDGAHSFQVRAEDAAGNSQITGSLFVTIDTTPPSATLGSQTPTPGSSNFDFTVTYADTNGVAAGTFDNSDITVTGPNSYSQNASFISAVGNVVTYRITAPGGTWNFGDSGSYSVQQNSNQILDNAANARFAGTIGSVSVAVPFAWVASNTLHVENGTSTLAPAGGGNIGVTQGATTLTFPGASFHPIALDGTSGDDVFTLNNIITQIATFSGGGGDDALVMNGGSVTFTNDVGAASDSVDVTFAAGGSGGFDSTQHIDVLTIGGTVGVDVGGDNMIVVKDLSVAGWIDLRDNDLVWDYDGPTSPLGTWNGSQYTGAIGLVASARNGGAWNGNGVRTSFANIFQGLRTIAVGEASTLPGISPFNAETLDSTAIVFKYTYVGDATLDGLVNGDDYFRIDSAFPNSGAFFGQTNGDFDFNGVIDADDYFLIDRAYSRGGPQL